MDFPGTFHIKYNNEPLRTLTKEELQTAVDNILKCDVPLRVRKHILPECEGDNSFFYCIVVEQKNQNGIRCANEYNLNCVLAFSHKVKRDTILDILVEKCWYYI